MRRICSSQESRSNGGMIPRWSKPCSAFPLAALLLVGLFSSAQAQPDPRPAAFPEPIKFDPKPTALGDGSSEVLAVAYSPDREFLATGGADKLIKLWEVASGKIIAQ